MATKKKLPTGLTRPLRDLSSVELEVALRAATEAECLAMLEEERDDRCNTLRLGRLFCRYNRLRSSRERREWVSSKPASK